MMMRFVVIILIITVVFFAGCASSDTPAHSVQVQQTITTGTATIGTPTVTTVRLPITPVEVKTTASPVKIFSGDYHWVEYRLINSVTMPPNPRSQWEYNIKIERSNGAYKGTTAVRYKITITSDYPELVGNSVTITKDGSIIVDDRYYETSSDGFLGGTETNTIKGILKPTTDILSYQHSREDEPGGWLGITPFGEMNISLVNVGSESMTVPAGTYPEARKYVGGFKDGTPITFWVARGVPVPVKYEFPNKYQDGVNPFESFELEGWG